MKRDQLSNKYPPSTGINFLPLEKDDLKNYKLSSYVISQAKNITRDKKNEAFGIIIAKFNDMLSRKQLPKDESLSRVISALRKLNKFDRALTVFNILEKRVNAHIKDQVIGPWTYAAILQVYRQQLREAEAVNEHQSIINDISKIWSQCQTKKFTDVYILTEMICFYSLTGDYQNAIELFRQYRDKADLPMYSQYVTSLIKSNQLIDAQQALEEMKIKYKKKTEQNLQDEKALRGLYDVYISYCFENLKDVRQAIRLFKEDIEIGIYYNNQRKINDGYVKLDFHCDKNYKKKEGGLPLAVAKVAFLNFIEEISREELNYSVIIVTGGHSEKQSKLKQEFPDYLKKEYNADIKWNENPKILVSF